jgi:hypothetical protein
MTWRSTLKAKARELVPRFFTLGENQSPKTNKANTEVLVRGSAFTQDGVDDEVCQLGSGFLLLTLVAGIN